MAKIKKSKMEELLAKEETQTTLPKIGDLVEGKIIEIGTNSCYLDLGPLGTGLVMGREMGDISQLKKGQKVNATVLDLENEDGYMELSFRQAGYEKTWRDLRQKMEGDKIIKAKITGANKGGLIAEIDGVGGFLPVSQLAIRHYPRVEEGDKNKILEMLRRFVGKIFKVKIIDLEQKEEKVIISEKAVESSKIAEAIAQLKIGQIIEGKISGITNFGAFVKFDDLEGMIHISEMAWDHIDDPHTIIKVGEKIKTKIINLDDNRISLSLKRMES